MKQIGGAQVSVFTSGFGGAFKQIQLQLKGADARILTTLAQRAAADVAKVPGAVDVGLSTKGQKPELEVQLNRGLAGSLGVTRRAGGAGAAAGVRRASTPATGSIPRARRAT